MKEKIERDLESKNLCRLHHRRRVERKELLFQEAAPLRGIRATALDNPAIALFVRLSIRMILRSCCRMSLMRPSAVVRLARTPVLLRSSTPWAAAQSRSHYSYSGPGSFEEDHNNNHCHHTHRDYRHRGFTVGIGGPVGSGKTALVLQLCRTLQEQNSHSSIMNVHNNLAVVTNDIFTQEDAEFLTRHHALAANKIRAVETGGCPHAAIREDVSANLTALEELTALLRREQEQTKKEDDDDTSASRILPPPPLLLCESGGDNLAANFSRELADLTLYVIDVAGGDKVPRKGGPGITQSDLLIINKTDLAEAVGADLDVMRSDADRMRTSTTRSSSNATTASGDGSTSTTTTTGPTFLAAVKHGKGVPEITAFILERYRAAVQADGSHRPS